MRLSCIAKPFKTVATKPVHGLTNLAHLAIVVFVGVRFYEHFLQRYNHTSRL